MGRSSQSSATLRTICACVVCSLEMSCALEWNKAPRWRRKTFTYFKARLPKVLALVTPAMDFYASYKHENLKGLFQQQLSTRMRPRGIEIWSATFLVYALSCTTSFSFQITLVAGIHTSERNPNNAVLFYPHDFSRCFITKVNAHLSGGPC